jgi:hypothetical protein
MIQEVLAKSGKKKSRNSRDAPSLQASPQALLRVLDDQGEISPALKIKMKAIFDKYESLVKACSVQYTATKFKVKMNTVFYSAPKFLADAGVNHVRTFSPLELVVTAILIAVHMHHRTDKQLLDDIKAMRQYLRIEHKDLRVNAQCWGTAWFYITEIMDRRRGLKPASEPPAEDPMMKLRLAIENGPKSSGDLSDSPLSSVPSSSDDDTMDERDTSTSVDPDATVSEDEDTRPRPSRKALGKRRAAPLKRPKSKLISAAKKLKLKSAKRRPVRKPEKKTAKKKPAKKLKRTSRARSLDITFDQL